MGIRWAYTYIYSKILYKHIFIGDDDDDDDVRHFCGCVSKFKGEAPIEWFPAESTQERSPNLGGIPC